MPCEDALQDVLWDLQQLTLGLITINYSMEHHFTLNDNIIISLPFRTAVPLPVSAWNHVIRLPFHHAEVGECILNIC